MTDININIKIPSEKVADFIEAFNLVLVRPEQHVELTDDQFLKAYIKDVLFAIYKTGKIKKAQETTKPEIDLNIVEVK